MSAGSPNENSNYLFESNSEAPQTQTAEGVQFGLNFLFGNCSADGKLDQSYSELYGDDLSRNLHSLGSSEEISSQIMQHLEPEDKNPEAGSSVVGGTDAIGHLHRQDSGYGGSLEQTNDAVANVASVPEDFFDIDEVASEHNSLEGNDDEQQADSPKELEESEVKEPESKSSNSDDGEDESEDDNEEDNQASDRSSSFEEEADDSDAIVGRIEKAMMGHRSEPDSVSVQPESREAQEKTEEDVVKVAKVGDEASSSDEDCDNFTGHMHELFSASLKDRFRGRKMKEIFPHYRKNKRIRFSRLFGISPKYDIPNQYAHLKKRKTSAAAKSSESQRWFFEVPVAPSDVHDEYDDFISTPFYISSGAARDSAVDSSTAKSTESEKQFVHSEALKQKCAPASLWYDLYCKDNDESKTWYGVPKDQVEGQEDDPAIERVKDRIEAGVKGQITEEEARSFFMVSHSKWEQTVMWELDDPNGQSVNSPDVICAWVPSPSARSLNAYLKANGLEHRIPDETILNDPNSKKRRTVGSFFPAQNFELLHKLWEDTICWDKKCPEMENPPEFLLDPADDNLIPMVNDDKKIKKNVSNSPGTSNQSSNLTADKAQADSPDKKQMRRSKILLGKLENSKENKEPVVEPELHPGRFGLKRHRFNLSNDSFYRSKHEKEAAKGLGSLIHHATTAVQLSQPFFPTYLSVQRLRQFHRWPLKRYSYGLLSEPGPKPVKILTEYIELIKQEREAERQASGGGDMFYMRTADDLSGRDGDLILAEFSEQHPPLMSQIGMSSKIRHYYRKGPRSDQGIPSFPYGELVYTSESPFLGNMKRGTALSVLENNMYRAPIYQHQMKSNDFLIIRCRDAYYIRKINTIFTVGQQYPLIEVPSPNSKRASHFQRDFLTVFIYRLFWASKDEQRRIKMEDIRAAFGPHYSESSIRKRLKICSDFKRAGHEQNWWNLKKDFRLPNEEELRRLVSPEECCAFYSMQAAEQRLRDAGYGDKAFTLDDNADDPNASDEIKVEDEIKCAPWNTTRAYLNAVQGKYLLDVTGIGDPTGCGEGFSFVRLPARLSKDDESAVGNEKKRNVTGTDADLRKLNLSQARQILAKHKIPEEEIRKLSRWETIDVIRTLSTEKAKTGSGESMYDKFARIGKYGSSDSQEKFKEECQRIFDQQNKVLASDEVLSSDDASSSEDDEEDLEEIAKNVENMMKNKKSSAQLAKERDEKERKELQKLIMYGNSSKDSDKNDRNKKDNATNIADDVDMSKYSGKILKIYRTFRDEETGEEYQRVEIVRKPDVVHVYISIRETKDVTWMSEFADIQQIKKEEERKKRRRYQDQLRRLERNKQKGKFGLGIGRYKNKSDNANGFKVTCGACGMKGHMKTNSLCPVFGKQAPNQTDSNQKYSNLDQSVETVTEDDGEDLIRVEDTKITLGKGLLDGVEKRMPTSSKKPNNDDESSAIYRKQYASGGMLRKRADPLIVISSMFEKLIQELKQLPGSEVFHHKVREKDVPDYYSIVTQPMDLQKMRDKCMKKQYKTRNDFLEDVNLIVCNSITYNGLTHAITENANRMSEFSQTHFRSLEAKYSKLEKRINPLLDDNDQVGFSFLLREIVLKLRQIPESSPFHLPVSRKSAPNYRSLVKFPMDLDTLLKNCARHAYRTQEAFLKDVSLIAANSELYNGPDHILTAKAKEIVNMASVELSLHDEYLTKLEKRIWEASQKAVESVASSMSPTGFSELSGFSGANEPEGASSSDDDNSEPETPDRKRPRAMITNLEHYFSSFDSAELKPNVSELSRRETLPTIHEVSSYSQNEDSTMDAFTEVKQEQSMDQYSTDYHQEYPEGSPPAHLFQPPVFADGDSRSFDADNMYNSNSNLGLQDYPSDSMQSGTCFSNRGNVVTASQSNNQDFLMNEESQDPEDMAKLLLGEISDSDNEEESPDEQNVDESSRNNNNFMDL